MKRQLTDGEAYVALVLVLLVLVGGPLLALAAADWDWRCLFLECRVQK